MVFSPSCLATSRMIFSLSETMSSLMNRVKSGWSTSNVAQYQFVKSSTEISPSFSMSSQLCQTSAGFNWETGCRNNFANNGKNSEGLIVPLLSSSRVLNKRRNSDMSCTIFLDPTKVDKLTIVFFFSKLFCRATAASPPLEVPCAPPVSDRVFNHSVKPEEASENLTELRRKPALDEEPCRTKLPRNPGESPIADVLRLTGADAPSRCSSSEVAPTTESRPEVAVETCRDRPLGQGEVMASRSRRNDARLLPASPLAVASAVSGDPSRFTAADVCGRCCSLAESRGLRTSAEVAGLGKRRAGAVLALLWASAAGVAPGGPAFDGRVVGVAAG
eukprot:CAMPEP_0176114926 /NCGR_PEP_ID=MMETSP0120_2-20121206/57715_1 /TAXON_ID=160619 /ORGANISM="Kryptoperidinium foliaceum, Strain CCMP 1326" /LENGTH=331 /DNA_ID=CAMNT_0017449163 /DNA_START=435 /DNA_END=1426 /DNA_ORIENTATION=-